MVDASRMATLSGKSQQSLCVGVAETGIRATNELKLRASVLQDLFRFASFGADWR